MIYDTFCFFNELDILEIRLKTLYDQIDRFVISESSVTHTGKPKDFIFEQNKGRFEKYLDKIMHIKVFDTPNEFYALDSSEDEIFYFINTQVNRFDKHREPHYGRDFFQKETVRRALVDCKDDDIIMFSDCDEIPNPESVHDSVCMCSDKIVALNQPQYYYYVNCLKDSGWLGTRISSWGHVKAMSFNEMRVSKDIVVSNAGWHYSFMGGSELVKQKISAFSAQELVNGSTIMMVDENIKHLLDPLSRGDRLKKVKLAGPPCILEYPHLIYSIY
jgi:beta-1,4-mannosyl-glycoprotein beta-1,4-N-acetylglucosaminyltransferase